jgi:hypothetical protein
MIETGRLAHSLRGTGELSTYLGPRRFAVTCELTGPHSARARIHGTDGVAGSGGGLRT